MKHRFLAVVSGLLLAAPVALGAQGDLLSVVKAHFDEWDKDKNGILSKSEIDVLTQDPNIKDEAAAAVATLKVAMRRKTDPIKEFPRAALERFLPSATSPKPDAAGPGGSSDAESHQADDAQLPGVPADLQRRFRSALRRIRSAPKQVFMDETPDLATFHQGPIGDCYFVSMVGAMAYHHPKQVQAMVATDAEGHTAVNFPGREAVVVGPLTDAELAISSTTGKDGLWLPIVEHAFGEVRQRSHPEREDEEATDIIAHGGSSGTSIELLTGHKAARLSLSPSPAKPIEGAKLEERLAKLREVLPLLIEQKRLVGVGTCKEKETMPPGVNPSHAYAVLGYDAATDRVTIWNPHGNTFKPKGEAGLKNGWPTRGGKFEMSLADMTRVFRGFVYETDEAVKASPGTQKPEKKAAK